MSEIVRVLLVDANPSLRLGLRHVLEATPAIAVVGETGESQDALDQIESMQPDVVMLDCDLPKEERMAIAAATQQPDCQARILALVSPGEEACAKAMIDAGAAGCVLKDESPDRIAEAVIAAAHGSSWFSPGIAAHLSAWMNGDPPEAQSAGLTEREMSVLRLLAKGRDNRQIADELCVNERTVRFHLQNIYGKIGVDSDRAALVWAIQNGFGV